MTTLSSTVIDTAATLNSTQSGIIDAGTYSNNYTASGAFDNNYSFSYVAGDLLVNQRTLSVMTNNARKTFGNADPVFTGSNNLLAADAALISWAYAPIGYSGAIGNYTIAATATDIGNRLANYIRTNNYGTFTVNSTAMSQIPNQVVSSFTYTPIFTTTQTVMIASVNPFGIGTGTFDSVSGTTTVTEQLTTINSDTPGTAPVPNPFITITPELRAWLDGKNGV